MPDDRYKLVQIGNSPRWYIQWFEGGRSRRVSTRQTGRAEAEEFRRAFVLAAGEAPPAEPLRLDTVLNFYLDTHGQHIADKARQELCADHLKAFYGATLVESAGPSSQDLYVAHRREKGVSDETIRRELSVMSSALRFAQKREKLERIPPIISLPKSPPKERWLTREEAAVILRHFRTGWMPAERVAAYNAARAEVQATRTGRRKKPAVYRPAKLPHLLLFTRLALFTGARSGAVLDLTWDRVDLKRSLVAYPVPGEKRTNKRSAVVPIGPALVRALTRAKRGAKGSHVVTYEGEPVERILRAFSRHMDWLGMPDVTPHTLRHTFATWAAQKGVSLFLVGRALGQSVAATTERYSHHQPEALRAVTDAVRRK